MSHTFSPEGDRRAETLALAATFFAAVVSVFVFFPSEGRVLGPLHAALAALLGQAAFVLPLGLALAGALGFVRRARPQTTLKRQTLVGLGLITIGLLPAEDLLGQSTGLVGDWFTHSLTDVLGGPLTIVITLALIGTGAFLTFDVAGRRRVATR